MQRPWIEFRKWPHEEHVLQFEVVASDGTFSGGQDFCLHEDDIAEMGRRLREFPRSADDEIVLELGGPVGNWAYWVRLRFWIYDSVGHAALTIDLANHAKPPHDRQLRFTIQSEVASLNSLGERLTSWIQSEEPTLRHELTPPWV